MCNPPIVARQRLGKQVSAATNTRKNRKVVGRVDFYAVRAVSKESMRLVLARTYNIVTILAGGTQTTREHLRTLHPCVQPKKPVNMGGAYWMLSRKVTRSMF
jgi:hypothetical protein